MKLNLMVKRTLWSIICLLCLFFAETTQAQTKLIWKLATGSAIYSSPVISDAVVYFGSGDGHLYAVDKDSGKVRWKFKTGGEVHSSPAIYQDNVLFFSADGNLYTLNKNSGKLVWKYKIQKERKYDLWDYYVSSPVIHQDKVYIGGVDSTIYALDLNTGALSWSYQTNGMIHAAPVIKNDVLLIGNFEGVFYALDTRTGKPVWTFKTVGDTHFPKGEIQKAAVVNENTVFFGSRDYNIYALDLKTGTGKWNMKELGSWVVATPLLYKDHIYFGTSDTHRFYCMDAASGEIKWTLPLNMRVYGSAIVVDNDIVFGCFNGKLYVVDAASGKIKSTFQTAESSKAYATLFDDTDHLKKDLDFSGDGYIAIEKRILALGSILSSPLAEQNTLYFGDANGFFYAIAKH